jgi:hypothetical protein
MFAGALLQPTQDALAVLGQSGLFEDTYLASGTALALHLGHRRSRDLDFYTREPLQAEIVAKQLEQAGRFTISLLKHPHTTLDTFNDVKMSLFFYDYPLIGTFTYFHEMAIASIEDIGAMKLAAISGRATKRHYVDLYVICQMYTLETLFNWYDEKYGKLANNIYILIRAIGYFDDAESDPMPDMLTHLKWDNIKNFFTTESLRLGRKYLED